MRFIHHNNDKMKQQTKNSKLRMVGRRMAILGMLVVVTVSGVVLPSALGLNVASARDYNAEIKALQNQINEYNQKSSELAAQSDTLSSKVAELQTQQDSIQAQINLSVAKQNQLQQQIDESEQKIKEQAQALVDILQARYYSSQTSSLDVLMNSDSVSDYVDRQTRQKSMGDQTQSKVKEIKDLKKQLEGQKAEVDTLVQQQKSQKADLAASQAEQQKLLDETQGQEAKYQEMTKDNNAKIAQLQKEQAEEIARHLAEAARKSGIRTKYINNGAQCGGGYPAYLCNAAKDSQVDPWGMYSRECVSYVAYKVASTYGWPSYWTRGGNNAKQWPGKAKAYEIPTGSKPRVGSVGVITSGSYGHVVWVEAVDGDQITVSQYNGDGVSGLYSKVVTSASAYDTYIYFDQMP